MFKGKGNKMQSLEKKKQTVRKTEVPMRITEVNGIKKEVDQQLKEGT